MAKNKLQFLQPKSIKRTYGNPYDIAEDALIQVSRAQREGMSKNTPKVLKGKDNGK